MWHCQARCTGPVSELNGEAKYDDFDQLAAITAPEFVDTGLNVIAHRWALPSVS